MSNSKIRIDAIKHIIHQENNITLSETTEENREGDIKQVRYECYYFIKKKFPNMSLNKIALSFYPNVQNHATVLHGLKVINNLIETDSNYKKWILNLDNKIQEQINEINKLEKFQIKIESKINIPEQTKIDYLFKQLMPRPKRYTTHCQ